MKSCIFFVSILVSFEVVGLLSLLADAVGDGVEYGGEELVDGVQIRAQCGAQLAVRQLALHVAALAHRATVPVAFQ